MQRQRSALWEGRACARYLLGSCCSAVAVVIVVVDVTGNGGWEVAKLECRVWVDI